MALLDDARLALRVSSEVFDDEISDLIDAAMSDMVRVGIEEDFVRDPDTHPLVKRAVMCYCKAHFGFDNDQAAFFNESYRQVVCDLLHSEHNIAAIAQSEE